MSDQIRLISDFAVCDADVRSLILADAPEFLCRIGGSDTDVVAEYHFLWKTVGPRVALDAIKDKFGIVKLFNGYYDRAEDPQNIARYCQVMYQAYESCQRSMLGGSSWLTEFLPTTINPAFHADTTSVRQVLHAFIDDIAARQSPAYLYPYSYVERILQGPHTLFRAFSDGLAGMRVLAVSPFADSIHANFARRHDFFRDYNYPEFELLTYETPITYHGLPADFYPDQDWLATLERLKREISTVDFDIALLSCGSYAVPLGVHIRDVMKKKAIYVGGCLQLFFGITGRRYQDKFFTDQINADAFIFPLEREKFLSHVVVKNETAKDAFGAYF